MLVDTIKDMVLEIPFLTMNNIDIQFDTWCFTWRSYTTAKALPITKQVELIDKQKFAKVAVDKNSKMFIIYLAAWKLQN